MSLAHRNNIRQKARVQLQEICMQGMDGEDFSSTR